VSNASSKIHPNEELEILESPRSPKRIMKEESKLKGFILKKCKSTKHLQFPKNNSLKRKHSDDDVYNILSDSTSKSISKETK
jgi:hypothetical protein